MPKWVADQKAKEKKEQERRAVATKPQSSSVTKSVNDKASKSTFLGGGASTVAVKNNNEKRPSQKALTIKERQNQKMYGDTNGPVKRPPVQTTKKVTRQERINQKMYGDKNGPVKRDTTAIETRRQAAVNQKMTGGVDNSPAARAERSNRRAMGQAMKSGDYDRAAELRGKAEPGSIRATYEKWDRDIADTVTHTLKQTAAADLKFINKSMQGITQKDDFLYTTEEQRRKADEKTARRDERLTKRIEQESEALERAKEGHSYVGKQALSAISSATGMATDVATGVPLAHMFMRSTATSEGQVKKKADALRKQLEATGNYTTAELDDMFKNVDALDQANAIASGGIEVLSELLFPGVGLARKAIGGKGMSIAERAAGRLFSGVGARASGGLLKNVIRGTAEEVAEEEIGGPLQALAGNLIYGNKFQGYNEDAVKRSLNEQSSALRSQIHSDEEARQVSARLSSPSFMEDSVRAYMDSGLSKDEATELAELSRDYLTASLSGDIDTMKKYQDAMVEKLTGGEKSLKEKFTFKDALDAAVSTSMMTMATGLPGAVSTMQIGNSYKESRGLNAVRQQAEMIKNWSEPKEAAKAQAIIDHIDSGGDISGTEVYDIIQKAGEVAQQSKEAETIKNRVANVEMRKRDLRISPVDNNGVIAPQTRQRYVDIVSRTMSRYEALARIGEDSGFTEEDIATGADVAAAFETGIITSEQVNELARGSAAVKTVFEDVTGINLNQFDSYTEMNNALMAKAADNMVSSARLEQAAWNDEARKEASDYLTRGIGGSGDIAVQNVLESIDPRDRATFLATADVARSVYEYARNTSRTWEEVRSAYKSTYPSVNVNSLKGVYEAAKRDKEIAETAYYGKVVKSGEKATKNSLTSAETAVVAGKYTDKRQNKEGATLSEESLLKSFATGFGINIEVVDDLASEVRDSSGNVIFDEDGQPVMRQDNGMFDPNTNTLTVNANADASRTITQTAVHELTHHIAVYAPDEYVKLSRYIMDAWYRYDAEGYNRAIKSRQALYKTQRNQDLSPEQALEEIIADGSADFNWADENFIKDVTVNEPTLADRIIEAIKEVLRKIREILASGSVIDPASRNALYDKAIEYDAVRSMWVKAAQAARKERANQAIDEWQEAANTETASSDARYAINENMTDEERYQELKDKSLSVIESKEADLNLTEEDLNSLRARKLSEARSAAVKLARNLGVKGTYSNDDIDFEFEYTYGGLDESIHKQTAVKSDNKYVNFVNLMSNLRPVIENAYLIKKYDDAEYLRENPGHKPNDNLKFTYVLVSAFSDGENIIPVKLTVMEYVSKTGPKLHVAMTTSEIKKTRIMADRQHEPQMVTPGASATSFDISLADFLPEINDDELEKYIPKQFYYSIPDLGGDIVSRSTGAYSGQVNMRSEYSEDGDTLGYVDWTIYDDTPSISYIETAEGYRRRGIARRLLQDIQRQYPDMPINFGYTTEDGTKLLEDITYDVVDEEIKSKQEELQQKRDRLAEIEATWNDDAAVDAMTEEEKDSLDEETNALERDIKNLEEEIGDRKPVNKFVRFSVNDVDNKGKALTEDQREFYKYVAPELKDENGNIKRYYHGTGRADRVGYYFDPERATSGPMAYFTDNEEIAENYSRNKADTSLAYEEEDVSNYHNQFVVDVDGEEIRLEDYWHMLPAAKRLEFRERAGHITYDDDYELTVDESVNNGNGGYASDPYLVRQAHGNAFRMLIDAWLDSGDFFNEEEKFLEVMDLLGMEGVRYKDPYYREEKVYEVYLNVTNPLDTSDIDEEFAADVEDWIDATDLDYYAKESANADMWDKNSVDPYDWLERLRSDIENDTTHAWTSVPDIISDFLREQGYDGIVDKGGKGGGIGHQVVIPFSSEQIKDINNEHPTRENPDIRYSLNEQDADGNMLTDGQREFFNNSKAKDEEDRLIPMYHVTPVGGFTIFDTLYSFDETSISFSNSLDFALNYSSEDGNPDDWRTAAETRLGDTALEGETLGHYKTYLNMEHPLILEGDYLDERDIYEWPVYAKANGYDGVIYRAFDDGADIYQVFSGSQVKDTRNQNPTNNPDIRYSITDNDEAMSLLAYQDAIDDSYEALEYYEKLYDMPAQEAEVYLNTTQDEESINEFYAALTSDENVPFTDPTLEEGRVRIAKSRRDFYNDVNTRWRETWTTEGEVLDLKTVERQIRELVKTAMLNSNTDAKYRQETINRTMLDVREAYQLMKQDRTDIASYLLYHSAQNMIGNLEFIQEDETFEEYKDIRKYLHSTRITLDEGFWSNETFLEFRKSHFGTLRLARGLRSNVDKVYQDLEDQFPGVFSESERERLGLGDSIEDLLEHIGYVVDQNVKPFMEAYSSEEAAELATSIAEQLYDIMEAGRPIESLGDQLNSRGRRRLEGLYRDMETEQARLQGENESLKVQYDERIREMKADHRSDMDMLEYQTKLLKERHEEALRKLAERKEEQAERKIRKLKENQKAKEERRKERQAHKVWFNRIAASHKKLSERLLSNTADSNIPQQYKKELARLLAAFDLQTVTSKNIEERRGRQAQKTIKMAALKTALNNIESNVDEFYINDSITGIMDELLGRGTGYGHGRSIEGLTIDELNAAELERIAKLLESLVHELNTYKSVKIAAKRQQTADIGHAQNTQSLEHAAKFGPGKDFNDVILDWFDRIINLDEMTAAYMFRRIDPDNVGLGLMYKELRRSFDKYVRNTKQLREWMDEILGEYQNGGKLWKKYGADEIEKWRSDNYAETIKLESGQSIRVSPAQMMSIYCLAGRKQAYGHMTSGGIVVAPNSFNGQIIHELKQKVNTALPKVLTETDIKNITARLSEDQIKVAQALQKLMAEKMAAWGNEASMNVIGIELFGEPDYFPIKSDKAGLISDLDENQFVEAIRSFGFTKAVQPGAGNPIMVEDIFKVVADHCNNMNLYNAYSESINDFMKVYNYKETREEGKYTVKQAIAHAYSQKATTFIMQFMRDLNGNVSGNNTGLSRIYNGLLSRAKKASVFANGRVALQQPTAISRAFYLIDPKYLDGVVTNEKATEGAMQEMFDHCPIALWKSWGYYDIQMGKTIEDVMMNRGKWLDDVATDVYGKLDNITWTAIWQMVKAETKDKHPDVEVGSDEFFEICNERMSEIVDLTQVVDSPIHRSHGMRAKGFLEKTATAFMSEPTLTFNMVKDGLIRTREAWVSGNKAEASKIFGRTMSVFTLQAAMVSVAAAIWDALRGKNPDGDEDSESKFRLWWVNAIANFRDEIRLWNKIYFVKDISSLFQGYGINNLALQGWKGIADGYAQLTGKRNVYSSKEWYENLLGGVGYLTGVPVKTLMTDLKAIYNWAGLDWDIVNGMGDYLAEVQELMSKGSGEEDGNSLAASLIDIFDGKKNAPEEETASKKSEKKSKREKKGKSSDTDAKIAEYRESLPDNLSDDQKDKLVKKYSKTLESEAAKEDAMSEDFDVQEHIREAQANFDFEMEKRSLKAAENAAGKTGNARNNALWDVISSGYTKSVESGNMATIYRMREEFAKNGGDVEWFDQKISDKVKEKYKTTIGDTSPGAATRQDVMYNYMTTHGVSEEEISEICYHSYTARDLKAAMRMGNEDYIVEELIPLVRAGLTRADYEKLYKYRNMGAKTYDGKYTDPKYAMSTGRFIWPATGTITSHFGWRNAPTRGASSNHPAIDIGVPIGTPVAAADGGVVIYAGSNSGYGNSVGIKHDNGMVTYYNHLDSWNVNVGDRVTQGQQIAASGNTGISTGPHLDFKVLDANGKPVDPLKYLASRS